MGVRRGLGIWTGLSLLAAGPLAGQSPLTPREYDLYADILRTRGDSMLVADSTRARACIAPDGTELCVWRRPRVPRPPLWTPFLEANLRAVAIDREELVRRGVRLLPPDHRNPPGTCGGAILVILDRPGFNADSTEAIVGFARWQGSGPFPGCGIGAGGTFRYRLGPDGVWVRVETYDDWVT